MTTAVERPTIRLIDGRRMQCKDIPDAVYMEALLRTPGGGIPSTRHQMHVQGRLESLIGDVPDNLFLAKTRRLIARGLIDGCGCGCRGDLAITQ